MTYRCSPHAARLSRRRTSITTLAVLVITSVVWLFAVAAPASASTTSTPGPSSDAFVATGAYQYRYGPAIVVEGSTINMLTCSPGSGSAADYIRYQKSTDGGATWSSDQVVLQPTPGSADYFSTCDPGVVKFGGYYYLAYTSTSNSARGGIQNQVFVARSTSITGPYDKWNGAGWGGNPQPFITYSEDAYDYGAGEPSLVVVGTTVYIYYSWDSHDPTTGLPTNQTRLATASTSNANWPGSTTLQGVVLDKRAAWSVDSADVKYIPAWGKFIAVNSINRFTALSSIQAWESTDGVHFTPSSMLGASLEPFLHNIGLSGDDSGQVDPSQTNYLAYAYGSTWGQWNTAFSSISYTNDSTPARPYVYSATGQNGAARLDFQADTKAQSYTVRYGTSPGSYSNSVTGVTSSPYLLTGLTNGTTYYITVEGVNASGSSPVSSPIALTPENYQKLTPVSASASSSIGGLGPSNAIDNNVNTFYSSSGHSTSSATEWLSVDLGSVQSVGRAAFTLRQPLMMAGPNFNTPSPSVSVEVSTDNTNWVNVDSRQEGPIVDDSGVNELVFTFNNTQVARYVRIVDNSLGIDDVGNYYLQLAEFSVYSAPSGSALQPPAIWYTAAASSALTSSWSASNVNDGNDATSWSSAFHSGPGATEWIQGDFGAATTFQNIYVRPRGYCFPSAFTIQYSSDGTTWTQIPGQRYSLYVDPASLGVSPNPVQTFHFDQPITARYFRFLATNLRADQYGNYYFQLAEVAVTG